ncbi:MAG: glycosyltransferase family 4 protein [Candidatus Portnoybacteria bacterium]|nr:glycosyltransferase family 4 protein [Candidatus Portnoybacteria bacterium]
MANNQAKKILVFSTAYLPLVGGAEVAVDEITKRLPDWRFDMITAKIRRGLADFERVGNVNIYRVGFGFSFDKYLLPFLGLLKAKRLEKENHYNLTWSIMASFGGFLGLRFKKKYPNKPWLLTLQEGDTPEYISKRVGVFKKWFEQIFKRADYFQAISGFLYDWALKMGAKAGEVVPNGVDLEKFKVQNFDIKDNKKLILTVSRLVGKNGIEDLIRAGRYLDFPFRILIAGEGPDEKKLKNLAEELNLQDKVLFLGHISHSDLPKYYSMVDVFVRPSLSEGLGNVFLEAMASGLPVIGTPVGGIPDFLEDGETGLFCEVQDPQSIAEKIKKILEDVELRKTLIENGLNLVREKYDWDKIALEMKRIFQNLLMKKNRVLILSGVFPPDIGGPATQLDALARELIERGYKIRVLTFGEADGVQYPYLVKRISNKWPAFLKSFLYLISGFVLALRADIIYSYDLYTAGLTGLALKKVLRKPLVNRFVGDSAWEIASARGRIGDDDITAFQKKKYSWRIELRKKIRRKILTSSDRVIVVSYFLEELAGKIGVAGEKIKVIYNSIDFLDTRENSEVRPLNEGKVILTVARLAPWKGVDTIIEIMPQLVERYKKIKFVVVGQGPEMENLKKMSEGLGLRESVFFAGKLGRREVVGYLRAADVFVLNTNYEGMSHTLLEAMKMGAPIITTKAGGNPETIKDGETGLLVDYRNKKQWLEAIISILDNPDLAKRLSKQAREDLKRFSWDNVVNGTVKVFEEVINI